MGRYRLTRDYANDRFFAHEGDVVEMDDDEYERLERDSPGCFEKVEETGQTAVADLTAADVLGEQGAAVLDELQAQTPTLDIDPEDKAKEIPGEGNKYTPASGYTAPPAGVRVVERAPRDRQQKASGKRDGDEADAGATSADTSASARVTAEPTPASAAADEAQLAGGVTAQTDEEEDDDEKKAARSSKKS